MFAPGAKVIEEPLIPQASAAPNDDRRELPLILQVVLLLIEL